MSIYDQKIYVLVVNYNTINDVFNDTFNLI
jgi:hypothetical protein